MAEILRGEIRWANLGPTRGREKIGLRPVSRLSHDVFNERSGAVITIAIGYCYYDPITKGRLPPHP